MTLRPFVPSGRRLGRAAAVSLLVVAALAGSFAEHDHSVFASGDSPHPQSHYITRHDPRTRAAHWHAVLKVVQEHECVACHNQRLTGVAQQARAVAPTVSRPVLTAVDRVGTLESSLHPSGPRAPPVLL